MKNCREIEELLPFYEEGELTDAEKRAVAEHLASCEVCRRELAYLKKANELVGQLPRVDEPPWFQQKIMAGVRREAEKKSFSQKWFYPLRIKIPVQIMATLVIAVLAVYIYRSGNEALRQVLPVAEPPTIETQKERAVLQPEGPPSPLMTAPAAPAKAAHLTQNVRRNQESSQKKDSDAAPQMPSDVQDKARSAADVSVSPSAKTGATKDSPATLAGGSSDALKAEKPQMAASDRADAKAAKKQEADLVDQERQAESLLQSQSAKEKKAARAAPSAPRAFMASPGLSGRPLVCVWVENPAIVVPQVEKILTQSEGKIRSRQIRDNEVILQVEVSVSQWQKILPKLQNLGPVQEKGSFTRPDSESIIMEIKISKKDEHP